MAPRPPGPRPQHLRPADVNGMGRYQIHVTAPALCYGPVMPVAASGPAPVEAASAPAAVPASPRTAKSGLQRCRIRERYLVEMRRRVTIATASRAPPRTPWKPQWHSTSSTWQWRRGVRCSSSAHRRACRHLVRDPMGVDRRTVTLGCSCGGPQPPQAAGALMRTETSHEAREGQRKSPIGR